LALHQPFLAQNDDVKENMIRHARENLDELTREFTLQFMHDEMLPNLVDE